MTDARARGVFLYVLSATVVAGGALWFVRSDPTRTDPRIDGWRGTVERVLPDRESQVSAETMVLGENGTAERTSAVNGGSYTLAMVCAGTGHVRVRLSSTGTDSGRAVQCAPDAPQPDRIQVGLADQFFMEVTAEGGGAGGAVFRWRLERNRGF